MLFRFTLSLVSLVAFKRSLFVKRLSCETGVVVEKSYLKDRSGSVKESVRSVVVEKQTG